MDQSGSLNPSLLEETVDASPVVLFALTRTGGDFRPVWMCSNVERILDRPPVSADDPRWWEKAVHPEDRSRVEDVRKRVSAEGPQQFEFRLQDGMGRYRWIRERIRAPNSAESREVDAVGSWSDVTTVRSLEQRVRRAGRMEAVARLAGGIAHEFNNLLTVILGNTDLLRSGLEDDPESATELAEIEEAAKDGQWMVARLLAFTADETGEPGVVDVSEEILRAESALRELLGDEIDLRITVAEPVEPAVIDPGHLRQIFINLAANARDAMPDGGSLRVEARAVTVNGGDRGPSHLPGGRYVALSFEDSGEGMDGPTRAKAVDPFFSTRDRGRRAGLGLSTVYGMVIRAGGDVQIESAPDEGTRVTLYLRSPEGLGTDGD